MTTILNILISSGAVLLGAYLLPGVEVSGFASAIVVAIVLALANAVVRPILLFFTLPVNLMTLGLFTLVVDALIIMLVAGIVPGFRVRGFGWALVFGVILALINTALFALVF